MYCGADSADKKEISLLKASQILVVTEFCINVSSMA